MTAVVPPVVTVTAVATPVVAAAVAVTPSVVAAAVPVTPSVIAASTAVTAPVIAVTAVAIPIVATIAIVTAVAMVVTSRNLIHPKHGENCSKYRHRKGEFKTSHDVSFRFAHPLAQRRLETQRANCE